MPQAQPFKLYGQLAGSVLQVGPLFGHDRPFHRAHLQADAAINASGKVDPIPISTLGVLAGAGVDAGNGARVYAVGHAFAGVRHNRVGHGVSSQVGLLQKVHISA